MVASNLPPPETFGEQCMRVFTERRKVTGNSSAEACAEVIDELFTQWKRSKRKPRSAEKAPRPRNLLVDGIVAACGGDPFAATSPALQAAGVAVAAIKQVTPDVTPIEIERRARCYQAKHPTWTLTPTALAKNWGEFSPPKKENAKKDVYSVPENWKALARAKWGNIDLPEKWLDLAITLRADLLRTHA
jgi:hypothetical protein